MLHARSPHVHLPARERRTVDASLRDRPPPGHQAAKRGQHLGRVAMAVDETRIGIRREYRAKVAHVDGVFEEPALLRCGRADELQQPLVLRIRRLHVARLVPRRVRWDRRIAVEGVVRERLRKQVPALFRPLGRHQMDGLQARVEPVGHLQITHRTLEVRVALPRITGRPRLRRGREPVLEHLQRGILSEQVVKRRGSRARQAENEDGAANLGLQNGRFFRPRPLGMQPVAEDSTEHLFDQHAAERRQLRLIVVGAKQDAKRSAVAQVSEIREADRLACSLVKRIFEFPEARPFTAERTQYPLRAVVETQRQTSLAFCRRRHGCWLLTATTSPVM